MVDEDKKSQASAVLKTIWQKRAMGVDIPASSWMRPVTHQDVQYLLSRYPFIELIEANLPFDTPLTYTIHEARSGWIIHDYGKAIATSPGPLLYDWGGDLYSGDLKPGEKLDLSQRKEQEGGEGEGEREFKPEGTLVKQAFDTVTEIVEMIKERGWEEVHCLEGTDFMSWVAWVAAEELGVKLLGYEATSEEKKRRDRLRKIYGREKMLGISPAKPPAP